MAISWILAVLTSHLFAVDAPKDDAAKKELEKFQGTWTVVTAEVDGNKIEELKGQKFTFRGDSVLTEIGVKQKLKFKLDPTKKPREIDWISDEKGKKDSTEARGIYEIDADTLKLSLAGSKGTQKIDPTTGKVIEDKLEPVGKRPKAFGEKDALQLILKREKK